MLVSRYETNMRNQLLLVNTITGESRALTPEVVEGPALHAFAAWSADKSGLYLLSNRDRQFLSLAWLDLATNELRYLREDNWDAEGLALTDDGRRMALVTNEDGYSRLELFDVSTGWETRRTLAAPRAALPRGVLREISWSRDGRRLAFTIDSADGELGGAIITVTKGDQKMFLLTTKK